MITPRNGKDKHVVLFQILVGQFSRKITNGQFLSMIGRKLNMNPSVGRFTPSMPDASDLKIGKPFFHFPTHSFRKFVLFRVHLRLRC